MAISGLTIRNGKSADGIDGIPDSGGPMLSSGADQTFRMPEFFARGDADGDGAVDPDELDAVYANYWRSNPSVISNTFGLGQTNVQLDVENALGWDLTVQVSEDLLTWSNLPARAVPVYPFADPDAPSHPDRMYRLRAP